MINPVMPLALAEARQAQAKGEVPVGAVICQADGQIIAKAHNLCKTHCDPTAHAEILAIRQASLSLGQQRLTDCDLYVTLEPCAMCAGAIAHARVRRLYFAAYDAKGGAIEHGPRLFQQATIHHRPEIIGGIGESEAIDLLQAFFQERR